MRTLAVAVLLIGATLQTADACTVPPAVTYDVGGLSGGNFRGQTNVNLFIGRVLSFNRRPGGSEALFQVLKEYPSDTLANQKVLRLPDRVIMRSVIGDGTGGSCSGPILEVGDVGLFGYYEEGSRLWLAISQLHSGGDGGDGGLN